MDELYTPKNKKGYIDETLLNTPRPQASSTVERKGTSYSRRLKEKAVQDYLPLQENEKEECCSNTSNCTQSSLGLLSLDGADSDFSFEVKERKMNSDAARNKYQTSNAITEEHLKQHRLAAQVLEKANSRIQNKPVSSLLSNLLKPNMSGDKNSTSNTAVKDESTVNASDLERLSTGDKVSFSLNEITARSSSLGKDTLKGNSARHSLFGNSKSDETERSSIYNLRCEAVFDKIRKSNIQLQPLFNKTKNVTSQSSAEILNISDSTISSWNNEPQDSLLIKLQNEYFTPAELAAQKLAADELEWHKEQDTIPIDKAAKVELSCFSGYIGDDTGISNNEKMSIGKFFQQKSDNLNSFNFKGSPDKKSKPIPLIDLTTSILETSRSSVPSESEETVKTDTSRMSTDSVISVSHIERALADMDVENSPDRIMQYLMNPKKYAKNIGPASNTKENINNTQQSLARSKKSPGKSNRILSEITNKDYNSSSQSSQNSTLKNQSQREFQQVKNEKVSSDCAGDNNIIILNNTSEENLGYHSDNNSPVQKDTSIITVSSITESPSISCSELAFSDDDHYISEESANSFDNWITFERNLEPYKTCVLVDNEIRINITSQTEKYLLYTVDLKEVKLDDKLIPQHEDIIRINLPQKEELLKKENQQFFLIQYLTCTTGKIEVVLMIRIKDMITKRENIFEHTLTIESSDPNLILSEDVLNFDTLPERTSKRLDLFITNTSSIDLPVMLTILQDKNIFSFENELNINKSHSDFTVEDKLVLPKDKKTKIPLYMYGPNLSELKSSSYVKELTGKLLIWLPHESKVLSVDLIGKVGQTKLQFHDSCLPLMRLPPNQSRTLKIKNSGVTTLKLTITIVDDISKKQDSSFVIDPDVITVKPGQPAEISVMYRCTEKFTKPVHRTIVLHHNNELTFTCPLEVTTNENALRVSRSDGRSPVNSLSGRNSPREQSKFVRSPVSSLSGTNSPRHSCKSVSPNQRSSSTDSGSSYLSLSKLPVETSRLELVWDCVKLGKTQTQEFTIRNRSIHKIRFNATINEACFKIVREQSEHVTSVRIALHARESRKIIISFSPNVIGAASGYLTFTPIETAEVSSTRGTQLIRLYGYGGHSVIDITGMFKDTSGKMWLSFGKMNNDSLFEKAILLRNSGNLHAFFHFNIIYKTSYPFMNNRVKIIPTEGIISPNSETEIILKFTPKQEDFKFFNTAGVPDVREIAILQLITGTEPTRGRLRKLYNNMNVTGTPSNAEFVSKLCVPISGERMPSDLGKCRETDTLALRVLCQGLLTREVTLILEQDMEQTLSLETQEDESCMFKSLMIETSSLSLEHSHFDNQARRISGGFCTIEPTNLFLTLPFKTSDTVLLQSKHSRPMPFEVMVPSNDLIVQPIAGVVPPRETVVISVQSTAKQTSTSPIFSKIMIYVENEVMDVEVKIVCINSQVQERGMKQINR